MSSEQLTDGRALVDATEQRVSRPSDNETRKQYSSGKNKTFTLKTQLVTDGDHHIVAISTAVPGVMHDKKLGDYYNIRTFVIGIVNCYRELALRYATMFSLIFCEVE